MLGVDEYAVVYPPNGIIPFHGFAMYGKCNLNDLLLFLNKTHCSDVVSYHFMGFAMYGKCIHRNIFANFAQSAFYCSMGCLYDGELLFQHFSHIKYSKGYSGDTSPHVCYALASPTYMLLILHKTHYSDMVSLLFMN